MTAGIPDPNDRILTELIAEGLADIKAMLPQGAERWLLVDVFAQRLYQVRNRSPQRWWPVSTATVGLDNRDGSLGTPPGLHRIAARIGEGRPEGAVFVGRQPTGEVWSLQTAAGEDDRDLILTRILTLEGLAEGVNRGPGIDSLERFIYLHGTHREDRLGRPDSHGCVRLGNRDILEVFDRVKEGDPVVII